MKEVFIEKFDITSLDKFWKEVQSTNISENIDIYLNYESADLLAFSRSNQKLLVKFFADVTCIRWSEIAEDENISDGEFSEIISKEINSVFNYLKANQPPNLKNIHFLSNFFDDYTYAGLYSRYIDIF